MPRLPAPLTKDPVVVPAEIQSRLEQAGLRRTLATRAVLGLFLGRGAVALTHAQALTALHARGLDINRVTLYRLLDRLAACGVLQRETGDDRTWHFSLAPTGEVPAAPAGQEGAVPSFECDACHRRISLTEASEPTRAMTGDLLRTLARLGHQGQRVELAIHGTCATCIEPPDSPAAAG